ncbi:Alpha/Beta hydrolase protein [Cyathus striatus]|nr:Alpha/Beta hydrolase protein [Cyathus striatus]
MELGPYRLIVNGTESIYHPESWNTNANIFFIDQPIGVSFFYADYGESVSTTEEATQDVAAFVAIFFEHFSQFKGRAFHMAGESYGGRYLPLFASAVYDQNTKLLAASMTPVNLSLVMIGNGMFDFISCGAAFDFCQSKFWEPFYATDLNSYDMTKSCLGSAEDFRIPNLNHFSNLLFAGLLLTSLTNRLFEKLSASIPRLSSNYSSCNLSVNKEFVQFLIYAGPNDWIGNHIGNERSTLGLEWSGQQEFAKVNTLGARASSRLSLLMVPGIW